MIRENGGFYRFKMIEVEKYPCKDKREAERREDEVMKELKASMNTIKSFTTDEERKEYHKDYHKEYYENNKEQIKEKEKKKSLVNVVVKLINTIKHDTKKQRNIRI